MTTHLPLLAPHAGRTARTLERCHERLAQQRRKREHAERQTEGGPAYERVLVTGVCVLDLIAVAGEIIRARGTF
jgi:hypothetical protein